GSIHRAARSSATSRSAIASQRVFMGSGPIALPAAHTARRARAGLEACLFRRPDGAGGIGDGHAHRVAVLRPGTVVVLHVVAEDLAEREPGVAGALADA